MGEESRGLRIDVNDSDFSWPDMLRFCASTELLGYHLCYPFLLHKVLYYKINLNASSRIACQSLLSTVWSISLYLGHYGHTL